MLLEFAAEFALSGWRFGFNSLGAAASVNHLHFQFFHLDSQSGRSLPVEHSRSTAVKRTAQEQLWVLKGYPLRALVYRKLQPESSSQLIAQCAEYLRSKSVPHTLLVAGMG